MANDGHIEHPTMQSALQALARLTLAQPSMEAVLEESTALAKRLVPHADDVSVTLHERRPVTVAASGPLAERSDAAQYDVGQGPCLEALSQRITVVIPDQATDDRWPRYSPRALAIGVGSSVSVPLTVEGACIGACNVYSSRAAAFDADLLPMIEGVAGYITLVLNNAALYFDASTRAEQMAEAMSSRAVIEQAKGILMAVNGCDADAAFQRLVATSQRSHKKLRDVAGEIVAETVRGQGR